MLVVFGPFLAAALGSESGISLEEVVLAESLLVAIAIVFKTVVLNFICLLVICLTTTLVGQFQDVFQLDASVEVGASWYELVVLLLV